MEDWIDAIMDSQEMEETATDSQVPNIQYLQD